MTGLIHVIGVLTLVFYFQPDAEAFVTLGFFSRCMDDANNCVTDNMQLGQYPMCSDCSKFVKCNGAGSGVINCPTGLHYDVDEGVCDYVESANCGTNSPTSATSATSATSETSTTSATSATSETSTTSMTSTTSETSTTSMTSTTTLATYGVYTSCVSGAAECVSSSLPTGNYPHCTDCSKFVICNGAGSNAMTCQSGLLYDVNSGTCDWAASAECGTQAP